MDGTCNDNGYGYVAVWHTAAKQAHVHKAYQSWGRIDRRIKHSSIAVTTVKCKHNSAGDDKQHDVQKQRTLPA